MLNRQQEQVIVEKLRALPPERVAEVEDFVDFLRKRVRLSKSTATGQDNLDFPVDDLGPWPADLSLRREDMYDGDGR